MPKRCATFSAVWPISKPTIGSVSPFMMPITGARSDLTGSLAARASLCTVERADAMSENHRTILSPYKSGARESASTPPARTSAERPARMLPMPESSACMPEAQLRIPVQRRRGAAEDDLVELVGRELLAREQRAARLRGEIARRERTRAVFRLEERRARAVHNVNGFCSHAELRGFRLERLLFKLLDDLGPAEVLREVVDPDHVLAQRFLPLPEQVFLGRDRKSTRLNSSHVSISYAVF